MSSPANRSAGVGVPLENVCVIGMGKGDVSHVRADIKGFPKLDGKEKKKGTRETIIEHGNRRTNQK